MAEMTVKRSNVLPCDRRFIRRTDIRDPAAIDIDGRIVCQRVPGDQHSLRRKMPLEAAERLAQEGVSVEVVDLRTVHPYDQEAVLASVKKTSKVCVIHEDTLTGGIGGEISAFITENLFEYLDAPVLRCASLDTPVPFAISLERNFLPRERLIEKLKMLLEY